MNEFLPAWNLADWWFHCQIGSSYWWMLTTRCSNSRHVRWWGSSIMMNMVVVVMGVLMCLWGVAPIKRCAATWRGGATVARSNWIQAMTSKTDFTWDGHHARMGGCGCQISHTHGRWSTWWEGNVSWGCGNRGSQGHGGGGLHIWISLKPGMFQNHL